MKVLWLLKKSNVNDFKNTTQASLKHARFKCDIRNNRWNNKFRGLCFLAPPWQVNELRQYSLRRKARVIFDQWEPPCLRFAAYIILTHCSWVLFTCVSRSGTMKHQCAWKHRRVKQEMVTYIAGGMAAFLVQRGRSAIFRRWKSHLLTSSAD